MDVCLEFIGAEQPSPSSRVKDMPEIFQKILEQQSTNKMQKRLVNLNLSCQVV